ncbi:carbonic anhydrase [Xylariaceae sp. FL1651]|nr:carbonic anhydrase [Xylariaceae sp. FL1651]
MASTFASELLQRNEVTAKSHEPIPYFSEVGLSPKVMIFCCFDPRVNPEEFLGLKKGEVLLVRNASGTPARNLIDIAAIDRLAGITEVIVVKHTDCGATHITSDQVREHILKHNPDAAAELANFSLQTTNDIAKRTKEDVDLIRSSPLIRKELRDTASGLLFDLKSGKVTKIV